MEYVTVLIYIGLLLPFALSFFTRFYASKDPRFVTRIKRLTLTCFVLTVVVFILAEYGIRPVGAYTQRLIYGTFALTSLIFFLKVPTTWWKIGFDIVLIPSYILILFTLLFSSTPRQQKINDQYTVATKVPGFLACGESVYIFENRLWMFQEQIHLKKTCLHHVSEIEIVEFTEEKLIIDIKHEGDDYGENLTRYEIENEGDW